MPDTIRPKTAREFNQAYLALHIPKEDLFWSTYMGTEKNPSALSEAEAKLKAYVSDPENLKWARIALQNAKTEQDREILEGWIQFFQANAIENPEARAMQQDLIDLESALFQKRSKCRFEYTDKSGNAHTASSTVLSVNLTSSNDETIRRTSFIALQELERWVLKNGYLELVKKRNEFARKLGFTDFFSYKLFKNEGLSRESLAEIFTPFEIETREKCFSENARIAKEKGPDALAPWQLLFLLSGDNQKETDPYFPFSKSITRWGLSFARLGIRYRGADLTLDLLDREGKYDNGFMHGPVPSFYDDGQWIPARIGFTSNATPNQIGSGIRGLKTLFHEGGHAAHFSNVQQNSPCYSQEFPPTSMAYAETQSMFCDSLLGDADWLKAYAKDRKGNSMPDDLIQKSVLTSQPMRAYRERSILVITLFEDRLYSMKDEELTEENVLALARRCEREIFNLETISRPVLVVPHLLSDSGACSYQGYLLANMAVYQTRAHFLKRYGYLTDNPQIGKDLETAYWAPGNKITHVESVKRLTGESLSGKALASVVNDSNEKTWEKAKASMDAYQKRSMTPSSPALNSTAVDLGARIRIVHGTELISENHESFDQLAIDFENYIEKKYPPLG
jgi:Zn-dependent oligopeptidase